MILEKVLFVVKLGILNSRIVFFYKILFLFKII